MCAENYETLMRERNKKDSRKWRETVSGEMATNWKSFVEMNFPPGLSDGFSSILNKIPARYFVEIYKSFLKLTWKNKNTRIAQMVLEKESKVEELPLLVAKTYYKLKVIKAAWHWPRIDPRSKWRNRLQK